MNAATAPQLPEHITCPTCRQLFEREEIPFPAVGDYCDDCACTCDRCGEEYGERDMVADADGGLICPECAECRS